MNPLILAAASRKSGPMVLLDLPMLTDTLDKSGNFTQALTGLSSATDGIVQIDGRGCYRAARSKGIAYALKAGSTKLFAQPKWSFNFELRYVSAGAYKHDQILATRKVPGSAYTFFMWNREQAGNKLIVLSAAKSNELSPMFTENTTPLNNTWYKYRFEYTSVGNLLKMYVNNVYQKQVVMTENVESTIFELLMVASGDFFDGWIRNIQVTGEN